ncbi:unnamed protein product [Prorocentrum cordatum]|uniref:Uncharacterized protein n=1 Tax=Prorocentrum cordatum TaxID=2364126 RepID=A0ABN9PUG6_9DINO|nr:unnamed protein product [Polarella glacialis]
MFEPAADIIKKRDAAKAEVSEGGVEPEDAGPSGISKKDRLMTKLLLRHEDNFRGSARDQNVVVKLKTGSQMQLALAAGIQNYLKVGKEARAAVEPSEYRGHPLGKKPDAYLRMLLFRLSEAVEGKLEDVRAAVAQGPQPVESKEALRLVVNLGKSLNNKEVRLKATRCFDVQTKTDVDGKTVEETKWIFAAMAHPPLMQAMYCLKENGGLQSVNIVLEDDTAPRSKDAKELEKLVFKGGGGGGKKHPKRPKQK